MYLCLIVTNTIYIFNVTGGAWSGELDGPDPDNPQTLINTAVRHVKSQIGLDLSCCKSWYKICEVSSWGMISVYGC